MVRDARSRAPHHEERWTFASGRNRVIEDADQRKQRRVAKHLVPMIESRAEWRLTLDGTDDGTEDDGHQQQRGETPAEADAGEGGESAKDDHAQAKANERPGRRQFLR